MDERRIAVSLERTVNLGNYESMKVFVSLSHLPATISREGVRDALKGATIVIEEMQSELGSRIKQLKAELRASGDE